MKTCSTCGKEYPDDVRFCPDDGTTLRLDSATSLIGSVVAGSYHITKKLGEGGMGAVYLGEHVRMGRKSAIKVMAQSMAQDPEAIARFNREAENASQINHPNVCGVYDFGETEGGLIYLVMEFIQGEALTQLLDREGALSPQRAADILRQTADALQAAHDLGIVHRDLKPDNIMIATDRQGNDLVKVVDFGIAKAIGGTADQKVTKTGLVVGTPEYMSPEQLSGDQLDGRSDIYSLGLVFFRTLTGSLPFQAESSQEVMIKRLTDNPLRLTDVVPGTAFPPSLQTALDRALQRMPADRYTRAADFGHDVMEAVGGMADAAKRVDTRAATQLVSPGAGTLQLPDTRISDARAPSPPPASTPATPLPHPSPAPQTRVKAIAVVVSALVIAGAGTAVIVMQSGGTPESTPSDTSQSLTTGVIEDTARTPPPVQIAGTGEPENQTGEARGQTGPAGSATDPVGSTGSRDTPPTVTPSTTRILVSPGRAGAHVVDLVLRMEQDPARTTVEAIRDTAMAYYSENTVATKARADAAYATALAIHRLGDAVEALRWARRAVALDASDAAYQRLVNDLQRGGSS